MVPPDVERHAADNAGRVALWLASTVGSHAVRAALREMHLPDLFDTDLETQTVRAAELMDVRGEAIDEVGAWCRQTLRWRALDLFRSPGSRRHTASAMDDDADDVADVRAVGTEGTEQVDLQLDVEALRRDLGRRWAAAPAWRLSAALTYLAISLEDAVAGDDQPVPRAGADELDRAHWAALHYAGVRDCFARDGETDTAAMRQRRKRRIDEVRRLLATAYVATREASDA